MRDSARRDAVKITLLALGCLAMIAWFIGQGLTIDNYHLNPAKVLRTEVAISCK